MSLHELDLQGQALQSAHYFIHYFGGKCFSSEISIKANQSNRGRFGPGILLCRLFSPWWSKTTTWMPFFGWCSHFRQGGKAVKGTCFYSLQGVALRDFTTRKTADTKQYITRRGPSNQLSILFPPFVHTCSTPPVSLVRASTQTSWQAVPVGFERGPAFSVLAKEKANP